MNTTTPFTSLLGEHPNVYDKTMDQWVVDVIDILAEDDWDVDRVLSDINDGIVPKEFDNRCLESFNEMIRKRYERTIV